MIGEGHWPIARPPSVALTAGAEGRFERTSRNEGISIDEARQRSAARIPAKRFGTHDEFGAWCAFLCSAQAGYITGQSNLIDGGLVNTTF